MIIINDDQNDIMVEGFIKDTLNNAGLDTDAIANDMSNAKGAKEHLKVAADTTKSVKSVSDKIIADNGVSNTSLVSRARNSVLQFPIYITQSMRVNEAQIISNFFARAYTTLVQTVLSQNPMIDEDDVNNMKFLKNFHTNLKESSDIFINEFYEPIDEIDSMLKDSVFYSAQINESISVDFSVMPSIDNDLILEDARLSNEPLTGFNYLRESEDKYAKKSDAKETPARNITAETGYAKMTPSDMDALAIEELNSERAKNGDKPYPSDIATGNKIKEVALDEVNRERKAAGKSTLPDNYSNSLSSIALDEINDEREANGESPYTQDDIKNDDDRSIRKEINSKKQEITNQIKDRENEITNEINNKKSEIKKEITRASIKGDRWHNMYVKKGTEFYRVDSRTTKATNVAPVEVPTLLRDADIKRINNLTPYTMRATFRVKHKDGSVSDLSYIIGVKSMLHLIHSDDLADDLEELVTGKVHKLQKVRYKTGEISTIDYLFNIKGLKADALKKTQSNKKWISSLKRLSDYSHQNQSMLKKPMQLAAEITNGGVRPIPNGTLVLSNIDVVALKSSTGIDLNSVSAVKSLARNLFLIAVCIVDESAGTLKVLFPDADNEWDTQSLSSIDAELSKTDNSALMKELNKAVNR